MATDPNIILAGAQPAPQPFTLGSLSQMMQMKQQIQQQRMQNALLSITRQPGAFGDDGMPTANTLRQISGIDPNAGMQMAGQMATVRAREATQKKEALDAMQTRRELAAGPSDAGVSAYYGAISSGATPQQAMQAGNDAYIKARSELAAGGDLGDALDTMVPKAFNLASAYGQAVTAKDAQANFNKRLTDQRIERHEADEDRNRDRQFGIEEAHLGLAERASARADANQRQIAAALAGLSPEAKADAAARLAAGEPTGLPMRGGSGASLAVDVANEAAKRDRGQATVTSNAADLYRQGKADTAAVTSTLRDFSSGTSGKTVRSINVSMNHLSTLVDLMEALHNGDTQAINKLSNVVATQTGHPAPTNFDAAKDIVADEVVKSIVGAGGTGADREKAQKTFSNYSSPEQVIGGVQTVQKLMSGQLEGLGRQYHAGTGRTDFATKYLSPTARQLYTPDSSSGSVGNDKTLTYDPATGTFK